MSEENKSTIVIDANLLISAIIKKGDTTPNKLLTAWREHKYHLVLSEELIIEVANVLKRERIYKKYHISLEEIETFLTELRNGTGLVVPISLEELPRHVRDPKDDKLLACALSGNCDFLITGDEDLLVLNGKKELGKLQIIKAAEFLQRKE
jgi:putative PIN family toxin of toxin-antitoxin system